MTDRERARYHQMRRDGRTPAWRALELARRWAAISDEQHEADRLALDERLREHSRRVFDEVDRFALTLPETPC